MISTRASTAGALPNGADTIHWQTYQWQQPTKITMPGATRTIGYDALQRPTHIKSQAIGTGTHDVSHTNQPRKWLICGEGDVASPRPFTLKNPMYGFFSSPSPTGL